jgi:hypothetical protein
MSRKTWINIFGLILSTTLVGLVLTPLAIVATPVIIIRPSLVTPLYHAIQERFMVGITQMMMKGIKLGREAGV